MGKSGLNPKKQRWIDLAFQLNEPVKDLHKAYLDEWFPYITSDQFFKDLNRGVLFWNAKTKKFDCD